MAACAVVAILVACSEQAAVPTTSTAPANGPMGSGTTAASSTTSAAVRPDPIDAVTLQVPAVVVPGSIVTAIVHATGGAGQQLEITLATPDGCAAIGAGSGTLGETGNATFDIVIPAFLVRGGCSSGPAVHRVLSDDLVATLRAEHSTNELATSRMKTAPPSISVAYRASYAVVPPCGGLPNLVLGDAYWRPRDPATRPATGSSGGVFESGQVVIRSADAATFMGTVGVNIELVPAKSGEVEVC